MVVVDISTPGCCYSDHDSTARVREHLRILLAEQAETAKDPKGASETGSFLTQKMQSDLFRQLKQLRPRAQNHGCTSLWDPDTGQYCEDFDSMIRIIKDAALLRQGTDRSDPSVGDEFLRDWGVDMSNCRTEMHLVEIIELILAAPSGKQPGPDGVPSEFFKAYAKTLAPLFQEGWQELLQGTYSDPEHLGCRKWSVIPKAANVRTTDKLRDLEMTNVVRKTLARMANRVLDEVFRTQLCSAQQAF